MPNAPQGLCYYPGIQQFLSANFTIAHGITPSQAVIYIAPQQQNLAANGTLEFGYAGTRISFPGCKLDFVSVEIGEDGKEVWGLHILDRRWQWKTCGRISGWYNSRKADDSAIIDGTEKTVQELMTLCLEAMGETGFDVSQVPNKTRPEVDWDYRNPADALAELADKVGCRVILTLNNTVSVQPVGAGSPLPLGPDVLSNSLTFDPGERPDSIIAVSGKLAIQFDLELEAVAKDTDHEIKLLDDLSYKPGTGTNSRGWLDIDIHNYNTISDIRVREYARETLFKWYRVKVPTNFPFPLVAKTAKGKQPNTTIKDLLLMLPLNATQLETAAGSQQVKTALTKKTQLPAWVYGIWFDEQAENRNVTDTVDPTVQEKEKDKGFYTRSFSIDKELGIVKFSDPVYKLIDDINDPEFGRVKPADLRLRVSINFRDEDTRGFLHYEKERKNKGKLFNTKPRYIKVDEIALEYIPTLDKNFKVTKWTHNRTEVDQVLDHYLDAAEREYNLKTPQSISYAGLKKIDLDGAIQQVTWTIDDQGYAKTRASRNKEELLVTQSFKERRLFEQLQEQLARNAEIDRVAKKMIESAQRGT